MKLKPLILIGSIALLSGCAAIQQMQQEWIEQNCNPPAAYNAGLRDGLSPGVLPSSNFASICPANNVAINRAYNRGFSEGLKSRPQEINVNKNVRVTEVKKNKQ